MFKLTKMVTLFLTLIILSSNAYSKELIVGAGDFEPFFVKKGETGLFLDLTREVFKQMPDYNIKFRFAPNKRLLQEINLGRLDAACNIFKGSDTKAFLSSPLFRFSDVAVTMKKNNLEINKIADLTGKSIVAYQGATDLLGEEYKNITLSSGTKYKENANQETTTAMLIKGRVDVRVGDIFIFLHAINSPANKGKVTIKDFTVHRIWPDVFSCIAFKDKKIRDEADKAIETIKANGTFDAVYKKYEKLFTDIAP